MTREPGAGLQIKLFGTFEVRLNGVITAGFQVRDAERLLVLLILNHGRTMQSQTLATTLWPETGSMDSLRQSVTHLRTLLGEEASRIKASKGGLRLELDGVEVDVVVFDRAAASEDLALLKQGFEVCCGPMLAGWEERHPEDEHWVMRARDKRRDLRRESLKKLAKACVALSQHEEAAGYLQQYVSANPSEEWGWRQLMQSLADSGERIAALKTYSKCRDLFHQKYQLPPPAQMTRLYNEIRLGMQDSSSDWPNDEARLEPVGGAVPLDSEYYVVRATDAAMQAAIARRDGLILLKGPRQTGKTSLLARGLHQARDAGAAVVVTDFQRISSQNWESPGTFLMSLAQNIAEQLGVFVPPEESWRAGEGPNENFERYLKRTVWPAVSAPIVWVLDEVDRLFPYPFCSDVFGLFRSWYNDRALNPSSPWHRITLAIAYATEAHLFISDLNQSPFNVGTRLTLEDLTIEHVTELNARYRGPLIDTRAITRFVLLVGGNPYLVRRGLHEMVNQSWSLETFEAQSDKADGCYGDHLQRLLQSLSRDRTLCDSVLGLLNGKQITHPELFYRLRSAGIIAGSDAEKARFRCDIYKTYLGAHLK